MLWWLQVNSNGTQLYIHMHPSSPRPPSHSGGHLTVSRVPHAKGHFWMKPQRTEGSWVWRTQEKGQKNIPGGWDSMNKGRDAENKTLGRPAISAVAGGHGKRKVVRTLYKDTTKLTYLDGRTRTACQGGPGQCKAHQGNLGESICVQTWLESGK